MSPFPIWSYDFTHLTALSTILGTSVIMSIISSSFTYIAFRLLAPARGICGRYITRKVTR